MRLLTSARSAMESGHPSAALDMLETVKRLEPDNREAQKLWLEANRALAAEDGLDEGDVSVAWNLQYAAGADESIDEPPPLAMDLFDADSVSLDESVNFDDDESLAHGSTIGDGDLRSDQNPEQDPFEMTQDFFSERGKRPSTLLAGVEPASSRVKTLKSIPHVTREALLALEAGMKQPAATDSSDVSKTLSDMDGFEAITLLGGPVSLTDTLDEESDDGSFDGDDERINLAQRRYAAGDLDASLEIVSRLVDEAPGHPEAHELKTKIEMKITEQNRAKLGSLNHCPRVKLRQQEVVWQSLDHHEGFIISLVDGHTSYEAIIEISAMGEAETVKILLRLVELDLIG